MKKEKKMKGEIKRSHSSNTIESDNVYTRAREREKRMKSLHSAKFYDNE